MEVTALQRALLRGDAPAARALLASVGDPAAAVFAAVLEQDFPRALRDARDLDTSDPLHLAVTALATEMNGDPHGPRAEQAVAAALQLTPAETDRELWAVALAAESAMSAGRVDLAEQAALWALSSPAATWSASASFAAQTLVRALLFQGRLADAVTAGPRALDLAERHDLPALSLVAASALSYVAVLRGDRAGLDASVALVRGGLDDCPPSYLVNGSLVLVAYALAADGRATEAADTLLRAAGGPGLERVQAVDRAYGYELLVTAELGVGDVLAARAWADRAAALNVTDAMATAAIHRAQARVAAATGDHSTGAALAARARELAAASAGHLDATRAALLAGSSLLADLSASVQARATLVEAGGAASEMGAVSLALLARRDLRSIGLRFTAAEQAQLTRRELEVAQLVIAGHTNGQIARLLGISPRTVQTHVSGVLKALGLPSRTGVGAALDAGAVEPAVRDELTARQGDVADLVVLGYTNDGIARTLQVSVKTVEKHLGDAYRRLGVDSRVALAARWRDCAESLPDKAVPAS